MYRPLKSGSLVIRPFKSKKTTLKSSHTWNRHQTFYPYMCLVFYIYLNLVTIFFYGPSNCKSNKLPKYGLHKDLILREEPMQKDKYTSNLILPFSQSLILLSISSSISLLPTKVGLHHIFYRDMPTADEYTIWPRYVQYLTWISKLWICNIPHCLLMLLHCT